MIKSKKEGVILGRDVEIHTSKILIPVSVIADRSVSILESLVEYLKDELKYTYHQIGELTNRDERTIWTVYSRVVKKREKIPKGKVKESGVKIPLSVLSDRRLSSFETVVEYLKDVLKFNYHEIGVLTNRNERTIWTLYYRVRKKRGAS